MPCSVCRKAGHNVDLSCEERNGQSRTREGRTREGRTREYRTREYRTKKVEPRGR